MTAGAKVLVCGLAHVRPDIHVRTVRFLDILTADASGRAVLEMDPRQSWAATVPPHSVWTAVDLDTAGGAVLHGVPPGRPEHRVSRGDPALLHPSGAVAEIAERRGLLDLVVARRGSGGGAWHASCGDGAQGDADGAADGTIVIAAAALAPVAGSPPPPAVLAAGDVVIGIDPLTLDYWIDVVGGVE